MEKQRFNEIDLYADKSVLVLEWLLLEGIHTKHFSVRDVLRDRRVSLGLVQNVFDALVKKGYLQIKASTSASLKFVMPHPQALLQDWTEHYNIVKQCKMWRYKSGFATHQQLMDAVAANDLPITLALHSAAHALECQDRPLETLEFYLTAPESKHCVEEVLSLKPQENGGDVLIIQPFYKSLLKRSMYHLATSPLLTFLDLYHFPPYGRKQAEYMLEHVNELKDLV